MFSKYFIEFFLSIPLFYTSKVTSDIVSSVSIKLCFIYLGDLIDARSRIPRIRNYRPFLADGLRAFLIFTTTGVTKYKHHGINKRDFKILILNYNSESKIHLKHLTFSLRRQELQTYPSCCLVSSTLLYCFSSSNYSVYN